MLIWRLIRLLPQISYPCDQDHDKLDGICKARNGQPRRSRLVGASTCAKVENIDGTRTCTRHRRYEAD